MTRLSNLRSKLFAHKLTSSISDNFQNAEQQWISIRVDKIDALIAQARLGYETMLSASHAERVDQRRSASKWEITYRQWIAISATVILVLDITINRQYQHTTLQQINHIINHTIISCEQLWLECIILYCDQWKVREYLCEWLEQTINFLNTLIKGVWKTNTLLATCLQQCYNEHYDKHIIILSDRLSRDNAKDFNQVQQLLDTYKALWYIRDYPSPIIYRWAAPEWLIQLKH